MPPPTFDWLMSELEFFGLNAVRCALKSESTFLPDNAGLLVMLASKLENGFGISVLQFAAIALVSC